MCWWQRQVFIYHHSLSGSFLRILDHKCIHNFQWCCYNWSPQCNSSLWGYCIRCSRHSWGSPRTVGIQVHSHKSSFLGCWCSCCCSYHCSQDIHLYLSMNKSKLMKIKRAGNNAQSKLCLQVLSPIHPIENSPKKQKPCTKPSHKIP